jgi:flagellar protein FliT
MRRMCPPDDGLLFVHESGRREVPRLIRRYEAIALASRCMLTAARRGDWDEVARLEERCRELIGQLKEAAEFEQFDVDDQRLRVRLLRNILADDAEMRARAEPWLAQLDQMIALGAPRKVVGD